MDPKHIVRNGYDAASYYYRPDTGIQPDEIQHYLDWLDHLEPHLHPGDRLLELGCGCGLPVAQRLASKYPYTGIDLSPVQCKRARQIVPAASILCADITTIDFSPSSFDAVLAFFSIIHVPLAEQRPLYQRIAAWLRSGGLFMVTLPLTAWTGTEENWHDSGASMYWSHADTPTYLHWLSELSFTVLWTAFLPEGENGFHLIMAKKQ